MNEKSHKLFHYKFENEAAHFADEIYVFRTR